MSSTEEKLISFHGAAYVTFNVDICYARDDENLTRLTRALRPFAP